MPPMRSVGLFLAAALLVLAPAPAPAADITVFAAASLGDALRQVEQSYEKRLRSLCGAFVRSLFRAGASD